MRRNNHKRQERRVTYANANRRLPLESLYKSLKPLSLSKFEDRRQWHPLGASAPARSFNHTNHRLVVGYQYPRKRNNQTSRYWDIRTYPTSKVAFNNPRGVLICVRRAIRSQVLHALGKTGKAGQKPPRYNMYSSISCKRS